MFSHVLISITFIPVSCSWCCHPALLSSASQALSKSDGAESVTLNQCPFAGDKGTACFGRCHLEDLPLEPKLRGEHVRKTFLLVTFQLFQLRLC